MVERSAETLTAAKLATTTARGHLPVPVRMLILGKD